MRFALTADSWAPAQNEVGWSRIAADMQLTHVTDGYSFVGFTGVSPVSAPSRQSRLKVNSVETVLKNSYVTDEIGVFHFKQENDLNSIFTF